MVLHEITTDGGNSKSEHQTYTVPLILNGKEVKTTTTFDVRNPETNKTIWRSSSASEEDAINAVESAEIAFQTWSQTKPLVRRSILLRAAQLFRERKDELVHYGTAETGLDVEYTGFILNVMDEMLEDVAGKITSIQGFSPTLLEEGRSAIVHREPYGVILGIAPWNAPWPLGCRAVCFALATGNTVVLKGSELSPRCYWAIADVFHKASLPDGCLNMLLHRPEDAAKITNTLIAHPYVRKINFCGSSAVGSIIAATAGKYLKPLVLELGGKGSAIVLKDADIKKAAAACALGAFTNAGQVCMSTERIIVDALIADEFIAELKECTNATFGPSNPSPLLVTSAGAKKTKSLISDALSKGATVVSGDPRESTNPSDSNRMRPIILAGVSRDMKFFYDESFGPAVAIFTFHTEEEALALANDNVYGLSGAVFTRDLSSGFRISKGYKIGSVHINGMTIHDEAAIPHGGVKNTGFGRFNGMAGLDEYLTYKAVTWFD